MDSFDLILVYVDFVEYGTVIFFLGEVLKQAIYFGILVRFF